MMNISMSDQVAKLAFDPSVRRAVQSLPKHQLITSDDRFNGLLDRLAQSERDSASMDAPELSPNTTAAPPRVVTPSPVER